MKITKVTVTGDLIEVEREIDGELKAVRRHVQNYDKLTDKEKQVLWHDIAGIPFVDYIRKDPIVTRVLHKLHLRK